MEDIVSEEVTFKGKPVTLIGHHAKVGNKARDFTVLANDLSPVTFGDSAHKIRVINVVFSLDTSLCDAQTRRFNEALTGLSDKIEVITISMDLPFAQARWCGSAGIENVLARAVFVVDESNTIRYVEYVPEVTSHPNYEAAIQAVKSLL